MDAAVALFPNIAVLMASTAQAGQNSQESLALRARALSCIGRFLAAGDLAAIAGEALRSIANIVIAEVRRRAPLAGSTPSC